MSGQGDPEGRPFLIGVTGPIGCGKSTVGRMLGELGGLILDADQLAREVTAPDEPALAAVRARFGDTVIRADGTLDRAALAAIVFADATALADLEEIIHPAVRRRIHQAVDRAARERAPFVVVEAIKLIEGGYGQHCDEIWIVDCEPSTQRARMLGRGMTPEDADRRIAAQGADVRERLAAAATRRISTEGALESTRQRVEEALADALEPVLLGEVARADGR